MEAGAASGSSHLPGEFHFCQSLYNSMTAKDVPSESMEAHVEALWEERYAGAEPIWQESSVVSTQHHKNGAMEKFLVSRS